MQSRMTGCSAARLGARQTALQLGWRKTILLCSWDGRRTGCFVAGLGATARNRLLCSSIGLTTGQSTVGLGAGQALM